MTRQSSSDLGHAATAAVALRPADGIAVTTKRAFVIRIRDGAVERVDVKRGASTNHKGVDLAPIFSDLEPGDHVVLRGTGELRAGANVNVKQASPAK